MKRGTIIFFLILVSVQTFARKVKFQVDMRYQTVSSFGVHVSGDFQSEAGFPGDWEPGTTTLTNEPGTSIYSVVVDIPAGVKYEYRYVNGDQEYEAEFIPTQSRVGYDFNDNRWIYIDDSSSDTLVLPALLFGGNAPFNKKMLRVLVDMQKQSSVTAVYAGTTKMYSFIPKVYETMLYADSASNLSYKFYNGAIAEQVPSTCATNGDRSFYMDADTILNTVCFGSCTDCASTGVSAFIYKTPNYKIYPNPVTSTSVLRFQTLNTREVSLINSNGKTIKSFSGNEQSYFIDKSELPSGLYIIKVIESNTVSSLKFIVE